jgi:hypothetical protein
MSVLLEYSFQGRSWCDSNQPIQGEQHRILLVIVSLSSALPSAPRGAIVWASRSCPCLQLSSLASGDNHIIQAPIVWDRWRAGRRAWRSVDAPDDARPGPLAGNGEVRSGWGQVLDVSRFPEIRWVDVGEVAGWDGASKVSWPFAATALRCRSVAGEGGSRLGPPERGWNRPISIAADGEGEDEIKSTSVHDRAKAGQARRLWGVSSEEAILQQHADVEETVVCVSRGSHTTPRGRRMAEGHRQPSQSAAAPPATQPVSHVMRRVLSGRRPSPRGSELNVGVVRPGCGLTRRRA